MNAPAPASKPPMTSLPPTARETQRLVSAATPGQALSPDPADFAYHVRATAFNVLTGKMAGDEWSVPRSERDAIARAVVDAVEPLIRADERAVAAQEPHAAPELQAVESVYLYHWRFARGEEYGLFRDKADAEAAAEARRAESPGEGLFEVLGMAILGRPEPQPAPEPSRTEWVVFWGGESPDDCAGWDSRDDEAGAEEHREWIVGGGVAQRPVMYGPWTVTVPPPPAERGLSGDWSDEELAEFRRWREQQRETGQ